MALYTPPLGFHFRVDFDLEGATDADIRFREVSGLTMELEEETFNEGGENRFSHKLPVRGRYPGLVLKRGLLTDTGVRTWIEDAVQNLIIAPVTVWVTLLNDVHEPLRVHVLEKAWPKKWAISDLSAETSDVVVETLELAYQSFRVE